MTKAPVPLFTETTITGLKEKARECIFSRQKAKRHWKVTSMPRWWNFTEIYRTERPWGFTPKPRKFFEKNLVKLLIKCNFITFFVNQFAIFLKSSPRWGRCHEVTDEGKNNVKIIKIYPSSASPTAQHLLPREGFKTLPSSYACHLPFQGRLSELGRLP